MDQVSFDELFPTGHPPSLAQLPSLVGRYMPFMNEGSSAASMGIGAQAGGFTGCPECGKWVSITFAQKQGEPISCTCGQEFKI
jgi:hypothetical protein